VRTTLNIDDEAFERLRDYAESRSISLGKAASELLEKGLAAPVPMRIVDGFVLFDPPPGTPGVKSKLVKELESELE